jgi:folate-dependent tRNA-U54 methylase TrmFO/GidA
MNKIKSWIASKTNVIRIDGNNVVSVDTLPEDIQFDIETYDKFRQDYLNLLYQQEIMHQAINGKMGAIQIKIKNYYIEKQKEMTPTECKDGENNAN